MNDKTYDILKKLASPLLPALAFFLTGLSQILHVGWLAVAGTIVALAAATLGKITGDESDKYFSDKQIVPIGDISTIDLEGLENGKN